MLDICEEVIRCLEGGRASTSSFVSRACPPTSTTNDFFFHNAALAFVPSHFSESFNIVFNGVEFAAHPDVLRSVADSVPAACGPSPRMSSYPTRTASTDFGKSGSFTS